MAELGKWRRFIAVAVVALALGACGESDTEPEVQYVPIVIPAGDAPIADPLAEQAARAEAVCEANGGSYSAGRCTYLYGEPTGDASCDTPSEQRYDYACKD